MRKPGGRKVWAAAEWRTTLSVQSTALPATDFLLQYHNTGWMLEAKQQMVEMALNGSGIRGTARVLGVSPTTVITTLKKKRRLFTR